MQYALGPLGHAFTFLALIQEPGGDAVGIEHRVSLFLDLGAGKSELRNGVLPLRPGHNNKPINANDEENCFHQISQWKIADGLRLIARDDRRNPGRGTPSSFPEYR